MKSGNQSPPHVSPSSTKVLYSDRLVEITSDGIRFHNSYVLPMTSRFVAFSEIDHIDILTPSILTGKWRLGGTSVPWRIWYPFDWHRPSRDRIFRAALKTGKYIGFTVEDSQTVALLFRGLGLIGSDETS